MVDPRPVPGAAESTDHPVDQRPQHDQSDDEVNGDGQRVAA
jgi:hypothetical protein